MRLRWADLPMGAQLALMVVQPHQSARGSGGQGANPGGEAMQLIEIRGKVFLTADGQTTGGGAGGFLNSINSI